MRPHQKDKRIVNGFETGKDGLFYQLMLVIGVNDREWQHFCGATLITNQYAMSAYHCFTLLIEDHLELLSADYSRKERLGTIHILRKHLYLIFHKKLRGVCQNEIISCSTLHFDKIFMLYFDIFSS